MFKVFGVCIGCSYYVYGRVCRYQGPQFQNCMLFWVHMDCYCAFVPKQCFAQVNGQLVVYLATSRQNHDFCVPLGIASAGYLWSYEKYGPDIFLGTSYIFAPVSDNEKFCLCFPSSWFLLLLNHCLAPAVGQVLTSLCLR